MKDKVLECWYKFLDFISFGYISKLKNDIAGLTYANIQLKDSISYLHNDNSALINLSDETLLKFEELKEIVAGHRQLNKNLQNENNNLRKIIKDIESKIIETDYESRCDFINEKWLLRHHLKKNQSDN